MRHNETSLADMDAKVKTLAGPHYDALKAEYTDWENDLRVSSIREITDLGVPYDVAESVLYLVQEVARLMDPNLRPRGEMVAGPMVAE